MCVHLLSHRFIFSIILVAFRLSSFKLFCGSVSLRAYSTKRKYVCVPVLLRCYVFVTCSTVSCHFGCLCTYHVVVDIRPAEHFCCCDTWLLSHGYAHMECHTHTHTLPNSLRTMCIRWVSVSTHIFSAVVLCFRFHFTSTTTSSILLFRICFCCCCHYYFSLSLNFDFIFRFSGHDTALINCIVLSYTICSLFSFFPFHLSPSSSSLFFVACKKIRIARAYVCRARQLRRVRHINWE